MWMCGYPDCYLPLFVASARALKDTHPSLRVGGPSSQQTQNVHDLISDTARLGIPLDFISTHFYNSDPNCTSNETRWGRDRDCFSRVVLEAQSWAADAGLPFLLTETNAAYFGHDTAYAASFLITQIPKLTSLDMMSWWTFSDIFECVRQSQSPVLCEARSIPFSSDESAGPAEKRGLVGWRAVRRYLGGHDERGHSQAGVEGVSGAASVGRPAAERERHGCGRQ